MEISEIITSINSFVGGDKAKAKDVAKALRADAKDVAQLLINVGAGQKSGETQTKVSTLEQERDEWKEKAETTEQEFAEFKSKTPDVKAIEDRLNATHAKALTKERERADKATTDLRDERKKLAVSKFVSLLTTADDSGTRIEPQWAEKVVAAELNDRFVIKEDGTLGVLQPGEAVEYDADTLDKKIAALAKDARKTVASTYVLTGSDSGAGARGGGGGGGTGLKTPEQIRKEKEQNSAFAGL